jgi:ribosome-binding protein aMBF1 (putative translation factor)
MKKYTPEEVAQMFGVSIDRIKQQHRDNAKALQSMYDKAVKTGKKVNGYTAAQLAEMVKDSNERGRI